MRNLIIPISLGILCTSFANTPAVNSHLPAVTLPAQAIHVSPKVTNTVADELYTAVHLNDYGLSKEAFDYAWKGYQYLLEKKMIPRSEYLTICDFSQSSKKKRLYVIDAEQQKLIINTYVAHGKNSGAEYANQFSNKPESLQSSLGFYVTAQTYIGEHGLSLRINGVDRGFNDKALERSIVIHGAAYVDAARVTAGQYMGRSWGCPAVPAKESATIITTIKNGTCLFIYHPSRNYLQGSKILNG